MAVGSFFTLVALLAAFGGRADEADRWTGAFALGAIGAAQVAAGVMIMRRARGSDWLAMGGAAAGAVLGLLVVVFGERDALLAWAVISIVLVAHAAFVVWSLRLSRR